MIIELVVNPDHSFIQSSLTTSGEKRSLTGSWSVDKKDMDIDFEPFLDFVSNAHGRQVGGASFRPEMIGPVMEMGPVIVKCGASDSEVSYVK